MRALSSPGAADGFQPLPLELVGALDVLPFDVHVRRDDRMVLYAARGSDPLAVALRARDGLALFVPLRDAEALRGVLLDSLAGSLGRSGATSIGGSAAGPADNLEAGAGVGQARRVVSYASELLAPLYVPAGTPSQEALTAALAAIDMLTAALSADALLRAHILPPNGLALSPAVDRVGIDRALPARGLAILAMALSLASEYRDLGSARNGGALAGSDLLDLGRGAALADLGMARAAAGPAQRSVARTPARPGQERDRLRRHVVLGPELVERIDGGSPAFVRYLAGHHERIDGSGYPRSLSGKDIEPSVALVGLADAAVALIAPRAGGPLPPADTVRIAPFAFRGRFSEELVLALIAVLDRPRPSSGNQPIVLA